MKLTPWRAPVAVIGIAALAACGGGSGGGSAPAPTPELPATAALIARAKALELPTAYVPPPGDALEHDTSGYAKTMCSAVFITGMDPAVAAQEVGYFTGPYDQRAKVGTPVVDRVKKEVRIAIPNGPTLVARYHGSQGCITLPPGRDDVFFTPVAVRSTLPDAATTPWPMGDLLPSSPPPDGVDMAKVKQAVDAAFEPAQALTAAFVVTYKGRLLGERYMSGVTATTPLESWSMGKSVVATLMGVLMQQGTYRLDQPAPIPQWQASGDPRQQIRIADILHMSSGLRSKAPDDPDFDPAGTYPDHLYLYPYILLDVPSLSAYLAYPIGTRQKWPPSFLGRTSTTKKPPMNS